MAHQRTLAYLKFCVACTALWFLCEVVGGLSFQALLTRPWQYYITPVIFGITSPVIWLIAFLLLPICFRLCAVVEKRYARSPRSLWISRSLFFATVMPMMEVLINEFVFKLGLGKPLYLYTCLPTFHGSGSFLSPLYYQTLLLHFRFQPSAQYFPRAN